MENGATCSKDPRQIGVDILLDYFTLDKPLPRFEVKGGTAHKLKKQPTVRQPKSYELSDAEQLKYVQEYLKEDAKQYEGTKSQPLSQLSQIEEESVIDERINFATERMYDGHSTERRIYNPTLPTTRKRDDITETIKHQQVLIIEGATGSGKTTQVPQFILDHHMEKNQDCNIIVTQPRRIAAISIARRVCQERKETVGDLVGYHVGMDKNVSFGTKLTYVTTGVLLKQLVSEKNMDRWTHVILDEIHERDQDMDFCLLVVRKFLRQHTQCRTKVILMSATFDVSQFGEYFAEPFRQGLEQPIVISLGRTSHFVSEHWLTELEALGDLPELEPRRPKVDDKAIAIVHLLIKKFDDIERDEESAFGKIRKKNELPSNRGGVLIFLPGIDEIKRVNNVLEKDMAKYRWQIYKLHSTLTDQEMGPNGLKVFEATGVGQRKIILSTNIAESSITVTDIVYVIDFCLTKNLVCDLHTNYSSLQMEWASKANCIQRKGRTGRIARGRCYRLVSKEFYDRYLPEFATPEMKRCPLEGIILHTKKLDLGSPDAILAFALDPPKKGDIERSVLTLKEIGALCVTSKGEYTALDGDITFLGNVLSNLPVDVRIGKLLVLGFLFGCLDECLIIAAGLSVATFFANISTDALECWKNKVAFSRRSYSDCFAILNAYECWTQKGHEKKFSTPGQISEIEWARINKLQLHKLKEAKFLIRDLRRRLEEFGIKSTTYNRYNDKRRDALILKVIMAGAFYPHYFTRTELDEREIARSLSGKDPTSTVVMSNLPYDSGFLYKHDIEGMFKDYKINTFFENTKCYVEFVRPQTKQNNLVLPAVYIAVKRRLLNEKFIIHLLRHDELKKQMELVEEVKQQAKASGNYRINKISVKPSIEMNFDKPHLPALNQSVAYIKVIWQNDRDYFRTFWAQYDDDITQTLLDRQIGLLNDSSAHFKPITEPIKPGMLVLAPSVNVQHKTYKNPYCRAKVEEFKDPLVTVSFFDFGYLERVNKNVLRQFDVVTFPILRGADNDNKAFAFEFTLAGIRPSKDLNHVKWDDQALKLIRQNVVQHRRRSVIARVYSVVQNVAHVDLSILIGQQEFYLKDKLLEQNFAEVAEESYLSRQNHLLRDSYDSDSNLKLFEEGEDWLSVKELLYNQHAYSSKKVHLKGPQSPLEVSFSSLQRCGMTRPVRIEGSSVNAVVLDEEPEDTSTRMMIASTVGLNPSNDVMLLRDTTLMPTIPNLPALISLLFAPKVELRSDSSFNNYTGILCGLGFDRDTKAPLYEERDMEIAFDTEITDDDLEKVNSLRNHIFNLLMNTEDEMKPDYSFGVHQTSIREDLVDLICTPRYPFDRCYYTKQFAWDQIPVDRKFYSDGYDVTGMRLNAPVDPIEENLEVLRDLIRIGNVDHLDPIYQCKLCNTATFTQVAEIKVHLMSMRHREKEHLHFSN